MGYLASRGCVFRGQLPALAEGHLPAHIVDVKRALGWIREHAHEYGADRASV
jgi:acetyl esterase/lipase